MLDGSTLVLDNVAIAAGTPSRVTAELSDQTGERVEVSDEAQISTNGIRGVWFREDENRIYVNVRTRNKKPFFIHACKKWDGSVLALFPKDKNMDIAEALDKLNSIDWESAGFMTGGRCIFGVKSLMEAQVEWRD